MSLHKDGDGISDELEEDLQTLPTEDSIRHGIGDGIEEDLNEAENNNFLTRRELPPQSGKEVDENLNEKVNRTINTSQGPRPRNQVDGGTKQLKVKNFTKGEATCEEKKDRALERIKVKIGEERMKDLISMWDSIHQNLEKKNKTQVSCEGDGVIRTLLGLGFSKHEVSAFLNIGGYRINRIMESLRTPYQVKESKPPAHAASEADIRRVLEFILNLDIEPGYPCLHRKIPLYVVGDQQGSTWKTLHAEYKDSCTKVDARVLSCNRFREYVKHYLPSIKLGKTQTDLCNQCFSLQLQMKDPDTTEEERVAIRAKLDQHLDEANNQRRAMNAYIEAVRKKAVPNDPPLQFEPCHIPEVEDEILRESLLLHKRHPNPALSALSVSEISDSEEDLDGIVGEEEDSSHLVLHAVWEEEGVPSSSQTGQGCSVRKLTQHAKDSLMKNIESRAGTKRKELANTIDKQAVQRMDLDIEDYGQEKLLPSFKLRRPGVDYFNSSLNIRNMNFINPTKIGQSSIYLYDERIAGKGGNEVCSIRWYNLIKVANIRNENSVPEPDFHLSVLDNCTGQNKSNTAFKFEALQTTLGLFKSKTKLFLKPGHSHNQSDVITGESNKFLAKKDIFTIDQMAVEMNKSSNVNVEVLRDENFYVWEEFLNKHFKDMPTGFTKFYCFEFINGTCAMKKLCAENSEENQVIVKDLLKDPINGKKIILNELFALPADATRQEIFSAPLKLPKLPGRELKPSKIESLAKKYSCIPKEFLDYYPGGEANLAEQDDDEPGEGILVQNKPKKLPGRPKAPVVEEKSRQSSIKSFFSTAPKLPSVSGGSSSKGGSSLLLRKSLQGQVAGGSEEVIDLHEEDSLHNNGRTSAVKDNIRPTTQKG